MKITEDVRNYAREHGVDEATALEQGMAEKAEEFASSGSELYRPT